MTTTPLDDTDATQEERMAAVLHDLYDVAVEFGVDLDEELDF